MLATRGNNEDLRFAKFMDQVTLNLIKIAQIVEKDLRVILNDIKSGGKAAMAQALALIESDAHAASTIALLDEAFQAPVGSVIGMTGPPGVGKSTLLNAIIREWRKIGKTVGCIAVDPSSRRSRGALLGDRTRLTSDPADQGVFFRSMAARDRLGGLASLTVSAMVLMRAVYDIVLIETVGVGQSETDVAQVADTVLFCVQPGSGDSLQFMKAGIAEIPHVVAVTKADMKTEALRAKMDVQGALSLASSPDRDAWDIPVILVSSTTGQGIDDLLDGLNRHTQHLTRHGALRRQRTIQAESWLCDMVLESFGTRGMETIIRNNPQDRSPLILTDGDSPFSRRADLSRHLDLIWHS